MLKLATNNYLVEKPKDLYEIPLFETIYADFETTSKDPKLKSVNPWHNCWPLGVAVTGDNCPDAYYLPWDLADIWLPRAFEKAKRWVNHNIKYDAHVYCNTGLYIPDHLDLVCTIMLAHLVDSDRSYKGGYSLDALAKAWTGYRKTGDTLKPYLFNSKDYGDIPTDILAEYANNDVLVNRALYHYCLKKMPERCEDLVQNEIALTKALLRMERVGLHLDVLGVEEAEMEARNNTVSIEEIIERVMDYPYNPRSPKHMKQLITGWFGLPVLKWTNEDADGNRTEDSHECFDKDTLNMYMLLPETTKTQKTMFKLLLRHRYHAQHLSLFYEPWQQLHVDGVLHTSYNQNLRTGRLSSRQPNEQQLDKEAKKLIKPKPGYTFINFDQSSIEFRVIANYIKNPAILKAYAEDADMDYHDYVAERVGISRRDAKTLNFSLAFGAGKKKTTESLAVSFRSLGENVSEERLLQRANSAFKMHRRLMPELQPKARHAEFLAKERGYICNLVNRHLQLPGPKHNKQWSEKHGKLIDRCHIALCGRAVQATAADLMKFQVVQIQPLLRELNAELVASVHDAYLFQVPDDENIHRAEDKIREFLETTPPEFETFKIPLRVKGGRSNKNWAECDMDDNMIDRKQTEPALSTPLSG